MASRRKTPDPSHTVLKSMLLFGVLYLLEQLSLRRKLYSWLRQ